MYHGHDYKDVKALGDYLGWRETRRDQLAEAGFASADQMSAEEVHQHLVEHYALAAVENRRINLAIQNTMTVANRTTLWMTLSLAIQGALFLILVAMR